MTDGFVGRKIRQMSGTLVPHVYVALCIYAKNRCVGRIDEPFVLVILFLAMRLGTLLREKHLGRLPRREPGIVVLVVILDARPRRHRRRGSAAGRNARRLGVQPSGSFAAISCARAGRTAAATAAAAATILGSVVVTFTVFTLATATGARCECNESIYESCKLLHLQSSSDPVELQEIVELWVHRGGGGGGAGEVSTALSYDAECRAAFSSSTGAPLDQTGRSNWAASRMKNETARRCSRGRM